MTIHPIILMRFSYLTNTNLADHFANPNDFRDYLYSPDRMEYRFWLFENFCLPSLLHQTDPDFQLVLLTSPELPKWCQERLEKVVAPLNRLIAFEPSMPRNKAFQAIIERSFAYDNGQMMTVRLDDDDAIGIDWIATLKRTAEQSAHLLSYTNNYAIWPSSGAVINFNAEDEPLMAVHAKLPSSAGLALVTNEKSKETAYHFEHLEAAKRRPTVSIPAPYSFLRVLHETNISHLQKGSQLRMLANLDLPPSEVQSAILENFKINFEALATRPDYQDPLIVPKRG